MNWDAGPDEWAALQRALLDYPAACMGDDRFTQDDALDSFLTPICATCAVVAQCHAYAVQARLPGFWAGQRYKLHGKREN